MDAFLGRNVDQNKAGSSGMEKSISSKKPAIMPWVEKYRPKTVDDVAHQEEVVAVLGKILQGADFPNLLFYGPPGTGKTSTILALSRQLFGDNFKGRILELNASDERGIQVIRDKVKNFAQMTASGVRPDGTPCPPFKIVILDEADSMTNSAQAALRRMMEKESKTTRFCLLCNYISRIIEPLTSRCTKFRFKPLSNEILMARLRDVSLQEGVRYDTSALTAVQETSDGDLRKAITTLQSAYRLKGELEIAAADVYELSGHVPTSWVDGLFAVCETNSYEKLDDFIKKLMAEGYAVSQFIKQLNGNIVSNGALTDGQKTEICECAAICDHRLMDGADEYLQIMDLCLVIMTQMHHGNK